MGATVFLFIMGLVMIALGGDSFVGFALGLAKKLRLPPAVVGATVVSAGTTLPEIIVSSTAAISGSGELAIGNALGSVICNCALIGGLGALLLPAKGINRADLLKRLFFFLLAACFIAFSAARAQALGVGLGIILLSIFVIYVLCSSPAAKTGEAEASGDRTELIVVGLIVGAASLYIGSHLLVDNAVLLAQKIGVGQKAIALTFIALGTSVPELATTICAVRKKESSLGLGNIVGASILNLLLVIGIPCIIAPMGVRAGDMRDLGIAAAAMCALTAVPLITGKTYRLQGAVLISAYLAYCAVNLI